MNIEFLPLAINETKFKTITVNEALADIKNQKYKPLIDALPDSIANDAAYRAAKRKLPGWAFHGTFKDSVINANFVESSGLFHFDVDKLNTPEQLSETKKLIVDNCQSLYAIWQSPSGRGLKGLLRILDKFIHGDANFKKAFQQVDAYFSKLGVTIDPTCKDIRRLCFVCSDPDIYINTAAPAFQFDDAIWRASDKTKQHTPPHHDRTTNSGNQNKYIARAVKIIQESTSGNHHSARCTAGFLAGGFIARGFVKEAAVVGALLRASDEISARYDDDTATLRNAHKAIRDGIEKGKLNPVDDDTKQSNNSKKQEQSNKHHNSENTSGNEEKKTGVDLTQFSINDHIDEMREAMTNQTFILEGIALRGQSTVIYAKPNTGKTLLVIYELIESVDAGRVEGKDVFYVNADDDDNGVVIKSTLLKSRDIQMLVPGFYGFESKDLEGYMRIMIADGSAKEKVIVLDTSKKFVDPMDKKACSDFMTIVGEFVLKGGTLLMLAHTNKHLSSDGKPVPAGTSDITDDANCCYTLATSSDVDGVKHVLFEKIKGRGSVVDSLGFSYDSAFETSWLDRFNSIAVLDRSSLDKLKKERDKNDRMERDSEVIGAIKSSIKANGGRLKKGDVCKYCHAEFGFSRRNVIKAINAYAGYLWLVERSNMGDWYYLPTEGKATAQEYRDKRDGIYR